MISRRTSTPLHQEDLQVASQKPRNYIKRKTICTIVGVVKEDDSNILQEPKEKILSDSELKRLWRLCNAQLRSDGREILSYPTEWISNSESQKVIDLIQSLSESVKKIRTETKTAQYTKEGLLLDQTADLKEQIRKLERKINYKELKFPR